MSVKNPAKMVAEYDEFLQTLYDQQLWGPVSGNVESPQENIDKYEPKAYEVADCFDLMHKQENGAP